MSPKLMWSTKLVCRHLVHTARSTWPIALALILAYSATIVANSVANTSTFSGKEMASMSMGTADILARPSSAGWPSTIPASSAIASFQSDTDLRVLLRKPSAKEAIAVQGRLLAYQSTLASGVASIKARYCENGIALSKSAARQLNVSPGDPVDIITSNRTIGERYCATIEYPYDTSAVSFIASPEGLSAGDEWSLLHESVAVGDERRLIQSSSIPQTLAYLGSINARASIPIAFQSQGTLSETGLRVAIIASYIILLSALLAFGIAANTSWKRRDFELQCASVLQSTSVACRILSGLAVVTVSAIAAIPVGVFVGSVLCFAISKSLSQNWGQVSVHWSAYLVACFAAALLTVVFLVAPVRRPVVQTDLDYARKGGHNHSRRAPASAALIVRRTFVALRREHINWALAIALIGSICGGAALVGDFAIYTARMQYRPALPSGYGIVTVSEPLRESEITDLEARMGVSMIAVREASITRDPSGAQVPAVVNSPYRRCVANRPASSCGQLFPDGTERGITVVSDHREAEILLGRVLSPAEKKAIDVGDGMLLESGGDGIEVVTPGKYEAAFPAGRNNAGTLRPLHVAGFEHYRALPGALISSRVAGSFKLNIHSEGRASYLLVGEGSLDPAAIVGALPSAITENADVYVDSGPEVGWYKPMRDIGVALTVVFLALGAYLTAAFLTQRIRTLLKAIYLAGGSQRVGFKISFGLSGLVLLIGAIAGVAGALGVLAVFANLVNRPFALSGNSLPLIPLAVILGIIASVPMHYVPRGGDRDSMTVPQVY